MKQGILDQTIRPYGLLRPAWWAVFNFAITLYGVLFKGWSLQPLVFVFWLEMVFSVATALFRAAAALDGRPFWATLLSKIFWLTAGIALGIAFIVLSVTFTIGVFEGGLKAGAFGGIRMQVVLIALNYIVALALHYFLNGRFRKATPVVELMQTFVYLLVLLCLIMLLTQHLIPAYADKKQQALWIGLAVIGVKFVVDWLTTALREYTPELFRT